MVCPPPPLKHRRSSHPFPLLTALVFLRHPRQPQGWGRSTVCSNAIILCIHSGPAIVARVYGVSKIRAWQVSILMHHHAGALHPVCQCSSLCDAYLYSLSLPASPLPSYLDPRVVTTIRRPNKSFPTFVVGKMLLAESCKAQVRLRQCCEPQWRPMTIAAPAACNNPQALNNPFAMAEGTPFQLCVIEPMFSDPMMGKPRSHSEDLGE